MSFGSNNAQNYSTIISDENELNALVEEERRIKGNIFYVPKKGNEKVIQYFKIKRWVLIFSFVLLAMLFFLAFAGVVLLIDEGWVSKPNKTKIKKKV